MADPVVVDRPAEVIYPESDGEPMADNHKQLRWILLLCGALRSLFPKSQLVFVSGNLYWFPVKDRPDIRIAPDALVVFGRKQWDRPSYKQWEEDDVPVTVAFEILSPANSKAEMAAKFLFYEEYGVEEYYVYDPQTNHLTIYLRKRSVLQRVRNIRRYVSPRLGIRFEFSGNEVQVIGPDGKPLLAYEDLAEARRELVLLLEEERKQVVFERKRADDERKRADDERKRADDASRRAEDERKRAEDERKRADDAEACIARMAALSHKILRGEATPEELAEFERIPSL